MSRFIQIAGTLVCLGIVIGCFSLATAQRPASPAEQKIREALEGDLPSTETGDGVLDDVLGIIRQRGSLLEGSSLDPTAGADRQNAPPSGHRATAGPTRNAYVAEQLLKASRLLESVTAGEDAGLAAEADRAALVKRMRAEAVKLLSE